MNMEELAVLVKEVTLKDDSKEKLPCAKAFQLSEKHSVPLKEIYECCNQNSIKISHCQLGCFK